MQAGDLACFLSPEHGLGKKKVVRCDSSADYVTSNKTG